MSMDPGVELLVPDDWQRVRAIRLRALADSGHAFGGTLEVESLEDETAWREKFVKNEFLIATVNGIDGAMMYVETLNGDFGATCWVGGCWTDPQFRGKGLMRAMFTFVDQQERDWKIQGLGVWTDNYSAISAYEKLGFVKMGEDTASTRQPGKYFQRMIRMSPA